ncbi:MAG: N-acetylmuramoyl-L-alanine amidase [Cyclobacteriaceae bacterium]|nr:N-acetylmuramoyl-L-alanine amidase [Cyclobacteriaceae bacterium]
MGKYLIYLSVFFGHYLYGQSVTIHYEWQRTDRIKKATLQVDADGTYLLSDNFLFNAVAFSVEGHADLNGFSLEATGDQFALEEDPHFEHVDGMKPVGLVHLAGATGQCELIISGYQGRVEVFLINSQLKQTPAWRYEQKEDVTGDCSEPVSIDQTAWRTGLPAPVYTRSFTTVKHIIVHHSAGANSAADYYEVVRAIYLYHTDVRGWSDIGYNYLIAPDGTLFKGRDPDIGEQDNVRGAHFCGKNSGTMGVCLLGTYTNVDPPQKALESLVLLIAWKLSKETLSIYGTETHAANPDLGHIAGHRDGCATECPGQRTYNLLDKIRIAVDTAASGCDIPGVTGPQLFSIYPNPATKGRIFVSPGTEAYQSLELIDARGQMVRRIVMEPDVELVELSTVDLLAGLYIIKLSGLGKAITAKVVVTPP